ncbi:MAG: Fic family protein [Propionibacteriaceae bacterium]|jgi:Fic family protein|nr:Fic family protein [Propionibacteriaceae bacterium]
MAVERTEQLIAAIASLGAASSGELSAKLSASASPATVKRDLARLVAAGAVVTEGQGRATKYRLSPGFGVLRPINVDDYFKREIDEREIKASFNWELLQETLSQVDLFTPDEARGLSKLDKEFRERVSRLSPTVYRKEMERLAIDLSWKSSQIEGNTYSLLETERLLKDRQTASGKTAEEALMLLNHKAATDFLIDNPDFLSPLSLPRIGDIHSLLIKDLGVARNIRNARVGITGTNYRPLDNSFQLAEALERSCEIINQRKTAFEKALLSVLLISYIQPFEDGNKRTARIVGNAALLAAASCPLSYRSVNATDYQKAILLFYEQGNISGFKSIFIEQFAFSVSTYF